MKPEDLTRISNALDEALRPFIAEQVEEKVREITQRTVREYMEGVAGQEIRTLIRNKIQDSGFLELRYVEKPQW